MALEIKTTRAADGSMTTHTPGAPASGYGDMLAEIIRMRQQRPQVPVYPQAPIQPRLGAPEKGGRLQYADQPKEYYKPQLGATVANQNLPRTRATANPFASPYANMPGGPGIGTVNERYIPGVGWEFDGAAHRLADTGALQGGAPSEKQRRERLEASPYDKMQLPFEQASGPAPINPNNRNNDARGEGYGIDYGRVPQKRG